MNKYTFKLMICSLFLTAVFQAGCNRSKIFSSNTIVQLPADEYLEKLKATQQPLIIDVRTAMEYRKGHLDSALNISFIGYGFNKTIKALDTANTVFLYCETAHRSPLAVKRLKKAGFRDIYDLKGGYGKMRKGK